MTKKPDKGGEKDVMLSTTARVSPLAVEALRLLGAKYGAKNAAEAFDKFLQDKDPQIFEMAKERIEQVVSLQKSETDKKR